MASELSDRNSSAVVFAYHNVGVRALRAVLDAGIDVRLVVSHLDNPSEAVWFHSVVALAAESGLRCITPVDAHDPKLLEACRATEPDFLFSFYYRHLLPAALLSVPRRGAFNLHGSLLPKYRGRAPVNWAILHGERETGATLHVMDEKPDHGAIVDRCAVPILADDTAREVFDKVVVAAEIVMVRTLPRLIDGTASFCDQRLAEGRYFGGRRPEDGRIAAASSARQIHDLVRAVAPPEYPGAFFDTARGRIGIARTMTGSISQAGTPSPSSFAMCVRDGKLVIDAVDGRSVRVLGATIDGRDCDPASFMRHFGDDFVRPLS